MLVVVTLVNFSFYYLFKPEDVILNQFFSLVLPGAGRDFTAENPLTYLFYHTFGDALSVIMVFLGLCLLLHWLAFPEKEVLYRFILIPFLFFETLQLIMPGNFMVVDIIIYIVFYELGIRLVSRLDNETYHSLITHLLRRMKRYHEDSGGIKT